MGKVEAKVMESNTAVAEAKAPFTMSLAHFMEGVQELNYPVEVVKDGYYRVINTHREHWQALRDGWSEEKDPSVQYKPLSAHPGNIEKAKQQQAALAAQKEAASAAASGETMVGMSQVQQMIADAVNKRPAAFSTPVPQAEEE